MRSLWIVALGLLPAAAWAQGYGESPYIFGVHEPGGEYHMAEMGKKGWIVFTVSVGRNPGETGGESSLFQEKANQGYGVIVRINHGYGSEGTIPYEADYDAFATRAANFVQNSPGAHIWIIGNETNMQGEWPSYNGTPQEITPARYGDCFRRCRNAIRARSGHSSDQVCMQGVSPAWGAGRQYYLNCLNAIGQGNVDAIALHTYTAGPELWRITSYDEFREYRTFLSNYTPWWGRSLPVYITETDYEWRDENNGWVRAAYGDVHQWNQTSGSQKVRAVCLYRWNPGGHDSATFHIGWKPGVIADWREAMLNDYRWTTSTGSSLPDVVVDSVWTVPSTPAVGQSTTFRCRVRNAGNAATPSGVVIGVGYSVNGGYVTYGVVNGPLAAGSTVEIGTNSVAWTPPSSGTYTIRALVDDVNRFQESNEANNARDAQVTVGGGPPPAPSGLAATALSSSSIRFAWNASTGASGYWLDIAQSYGDLVNMTGTFRNYHTGLSTTHTWQGLAASTTYYWRVYAYNASGGQHGYPSPTTVTTLAATNRLPYGYLDSATTSVIAGWAYDPDVAGPIWVHVYIDGVYRGAVSANLSRPDLVSAGVAPDPYHGFSMATPALTPGTHEVKAYAINVPSGTNPQLTNTRYITVSGGSVTGGAGPASMGSGYKVQDVTPVNTWRWSEYYWGLASIDEIRWLQDATGTWHNYVIGWHGGDKAEYLMQFGGSCNRLVLRGMADRPGPVVLNVYVDGVYRGQVTWGNNNNANQDSSLVVWGLTFGTHAICVEFANDYWAGYIGDGDRNLYLDGLFVTTP